MLPWNAFLIFDIRFKSEKIEKIAMTVTIVMTVSITRAFTVAMTVSMVSIVIIAKAVTMARMVTIAMTSLTLLDKLGKV